jgi:hypothetical protein
MEDRYVRSLRVLAVVVVLGVFAAACGSASQIGELKTQIEAVLSSELPDISVNDVNCGSPEPTLDPGDIFFCTAGVDNGRVRIQVTIDADGVARYERLNALVDLDRLELEITSDLSFDIGIDVTVDCGDGFKVEEIESNFVCTVSASGETRGVRVTVKDIDATTEWFFPVAVASS